MNLTRNKNYIYIIISLIISTVFFIIFVLAGLYLLKKPNVHWIVYTLLSLWIISGSFAPMYAFAIISKVKLAYEKDFKIFKDEVIKNNLKREMSALKITMLLFFLPVSLIVMINAYLKSGLSVKQKNHAQKLIYTYEVFKLIEANKINDFIKKNDLEKEVENILWLYKNQMNTKLNLSKYLLTLLEENKFNLKSNIVLDQKEIYYQGINS